MDNENMTQGIPATPIQPAPEHKSSGALIGSVIVLIILILGGVYLWSTKVQPIPEVLPTNQIIINEPSGEAADPALIQLESQATSDETAAIEADLNATNLNELDKEVQAI